MKTTGIIGIADTPEDAEKNAFDAQAHEARRQTMAKLVAGHAVKIEFNDGVDIKLSIGDFTFSDKYDVYPSETLVAQVVLAADAAQFNPDNFKILDFAADDIVEFEKVRNAANDARWTLNSLALGNIRRRTLGVQP